MQLQFNWTSIFKTNPSLKSIELLCVKERLVWILMHVTVTLTPFKSSCTHQKVPHLETNAPSKHIFLLFCVCEHSSLRSLREPEKGFPSSTFAKSSPHQDIIHLIHKFRSI